VLDRLRATGLYDRSLVVVTADNGESFGRLGNGHEISRRNAVDIALTPLIAKLPGEHSRPHRATACSDHRRAADDRTDSPHEHPLAGPRAFRVRAGRPPDPTVDAAHKRSGQRLRLSYGWLIRGADGSLRLKLRLFGSGNEPPGYFGIGPRRSLHGTAVSRLTGAASGPHPRRHRRGRPLRRRVPLLELSAGEGDGQAELAQADRHRRRGQRLFSVLVHEGSLRPGRNNRELYAIVGPTTLRRLTP
jgi:hypothetical protein